LENPGRAENLAVIGSGILAAAIDVMDQHKTEEAIAEFRKAIELCPAMRWLPHHNLAIIQGAQGKTKEADAEDPKAKELGAKRPN
jgi:Flp pilus assembly protein TadD